MALKAICLPSASETLQECTVSSFHKTATHTSIKPGRHSTHPQNKIWPLNSPAYTSNLPSQPPRTVLAYIHLFAFSIILTPSRILTHTRQSPAITLHRYPSLRAVSIQTSDNLRTSTYKTS